MHVNERDQSPSLNFCFISGTPRTIFTYLSLQNLVIRRNPEN